VDLLDRNTFVERGPAAFAVLPDDCFVNVLNREVVGVESEEAAHAVELHAFERAAEGGFVFDLAAGGIKGCYDGVRGVVGDGGVGGGDAVVFCLERGVELFRGRVL
jgi:hypothetical protein